MLKRNGQPCIQAKSLYWLGVIWSGGGETMWRHGFLKAFARPLRVPWLTSQKRTWTHAISSLISFYRTPVQSGSKSLKLVLECCCLVLYCRELFSELNPFIEQNGKTSYQLKCKPGLYICCTSQTKFITNTATIVHMYTYRVGELSWTPFIFNCLVKCLHCNSIYDAKMMWS